MNTWENYVTTCAALLFLYAVVRVSIVDNLRVPKEPVNPEPGQAIDAGPLSARVEQVKQHYESPIPAGAFKKPLLVEQRRAELSRLAFFQRQPPAEPPDPAHGEGMTLLFV